MRRIIIIIIACIGFYSGAEAADPQALLNEGNAFYAKAEFDKAISKYKEIADAGLASKQLYFNLGNAYYKIHDIKSAILYYEKARLMDPSDEDVLFNLELARTSTIDKINVVPEVFFITWIKWLRDRLSVDGWALLSILTFIASLSLFLLYLLSGRLSFRKLGFWMGVVMLFVAITSFAMGLQLNQTQKAGNTAIVFTPTVTLKSSPSESGNNLFILHEGTKVYILDEAGEWREIKIADGTRGWIKITDIKII